LNEIAKSKMNDLSLMKAKGGHSWPPLLCEANVEYAMRPFLSISIIAVMSCSKFT
jgi:hypothetical protein